MFRVFIIMAIELALPTKGGGVAHTHKLKLCRWV